MDNNEKQPFAAVLSAVFDAESISVPFLFRFSDMLPDEQAQFDTRWPKLNPTRRYEIMQHLADVSEDNFAVDFGPVFALGLQDEDAAVRKAALDGLWDNENVKMVRPIMRLMQTDPNLEVRATAAQSLAHYVLLGEWGRIADTVKNDIIDALLVEYRSLENDLLLRCAALEALGAADHDDVPDLIANAYDKGDVALQASALFAMGTSADSRWIGIVLDEMESPYVEMRLQAVRAAGGIGDSEAVDMLSELAFDEDTEVRIEAILSLGRIGNSRALQILNQFADDDEMADLHEFIDEALEISAASDVDFLNFDLDLDDDDFDDE
jgi:HEAT repeat protein